MTHDQAIIKAREATGCDAPVVVAQDCQVWGDGGARPAWDVIFWASEAEAENDDGARAVARVRVTDGAITVIGG